MSVIKGIFFDNGGIILPEEDNYAQVLDFIKRAVREAGIEVTDEEFAEGVRACLLSYVPSLQSAVIWHFARPDAERYERILGLYRSYGNPWASLMEKPPRPGIRELIERMSGRCKLALAANASPDIRMALNRHALLGYFSSTLVSGDLRYAKPDVRFFEHILSNCGLKPQETIMIGDRPDNDIVPAKALGMKAIHYKAAPYDILEPRTPLEVPDKVVSTVDELGVALDELIGGTA